jgi:hypothetical protein
VKILLQGIKQNVHALRKIFGFKEDEVTGKWKQYHIMKRYMILTIIFLKTLTVLRGPLAYPNGLLDLHIETFW